MKAGLRPYQTDGIRFLSARGGGCLADEPGVGKTVQALRAVRRIHPTGRVLVVCPKNATGVWLEQALEWNDEVAIGYNGWKRDRDVLTGSYSMVITNYTLMREAIVGGKYVAVIFDESHKLRKKSFRRGKDKPPNTLYGWLNEFRAQLPATKMFLTGTPIFSNAADIWTTLNLLDPKRYSSYWAFAKKFTNVERNEYGGWTVEGTRNEPELWAELSRWVLRRRKAEVQQYLPPKVRQRIPLTMTPKQATAYKRVAKEMMLESDDGQLVLTPGKLAQMTRLRQLLVTPRILGINENGAALDALIEDLQDRPRPLVVFTPFTEALNYIEEAVEGARAGFVIQLHGGMSTRQLEDAYRTFNKAEPNVPLVLAANVQMATSWSVAGTASECRMMGYDWSPSVQIQAEDRLHREGAIDTVFAGYYVHKGTVDRHVMEILEGKVTIAQLVLDPRNIIDF